MSEVPILIPDSPVLKRVRDFCAASGTAVVGLGALVLTGWATDNEVLKSVLPGLVTMKANTALSLAFCGISLWLLLPVASRSTSRYTSRYIARLLATIVILVSIGTLVEEFFGVNLHIDEVLFRDFKGPIGTSAPGRMSPVSSTVFVSLGLALLLLDSKKRHAIFLSQLFSLWGVGMALLAATGYAYQAKSLSRILLYTQVALHTAIGLFFLSIAVFLARPWSGIARELTGEGSGGVMARRFLPAVFVVPIFLGWIFLRGQVAGFYGPELRLALYGASDVVIFAFLVWLSARKMNEESSQRSLAELGILTLNADLEERVAERTKTLKQQAALLELAHDAIIVRDMQNHVVFWNHGAEIMYGWPEQQAMGKSVLELLKSEFSRPIAEIEAQLLQDNHWEGEAIHYSRDGSRLVISSRWALQRENYGTAARILMIDSDITQSKTAEKALQVSEAFHSHSAQHDFLTGLPNRTLVNDRINQAITLAQRSSKKVGVLFLDLDGFKHINDSLGHSIGDQLLQSVGVRLKSCIRGSDTVSRQGGDEFIVLLAEMELAEDAAITARRMLQVVAKPHSIEDHDLHVSASIGVSVFPDDGLNAETLIKNADTAMYQAKENGRQSYQFFKSAMNVRAVERQSLEESLRRAVERQEFSLHYQPMINLKTGEIAGAEALLRWTHPIRGRINPAAFIPVAEDCGLIVPIGRWVLREACNQTRAWLDAGLSLPTIAVNISAMEFRDEHFLESVFAILKDADLDPRILNLEMTETVLMNRLESTEAILKALRAAGVQVSVDDFGTGYSSLSYLRKFHIDVLKIDQSFVRQLTTAPDETSIVRAIISMARSLNLRVVAEGVETPKEAAFLKANQCDEAQGYHFSRPAPADRFAKLLETGISFQQASGISGGPN